MTALAPTLQAFLSELSDYVELGARRPNGRRQRTLWSA
jgi:hypothetical protein